MHWLPWPHCTLAEKERDLSPLFHSRPARLLNGHCESASRGRSSVSSNFGGFIPTQTLDGRFARLHPVPLVVIGIDRFPDTQEYNPDKLGH